MFVKSAPGVKVRDPATKQHLPDAGAEVPASTYWLRRLEAGDVVAAVPALERDEKAKPAKGKE